MELHRNINDVGAVIDRSFLYFNEARRALEVGDTADVFQNLGNLRALGRRIQGMLDKLTEEYRELEDSTPQVQSVQRDRLRNLIIGTMVLNVIIALALVVIFNKSTARRHDVLVKNASRFSSRQELLEPLSGDDEIAGIDKVFHEMARSIESAAKQKSEFTAMIAHDLRSPLTSLRITIEFLAKKYEHILPAEGLKEFFRVERDVERLVSLITELLDLDKLEAGQMTLEREMVPVAHIFETALSAIKSLADKKDIVVTVPETEDVVFVDSVRMIQVVSNILSNSIKFSPPGGRITIDVSRTSRMYQFSVTDQGPGIPVDKVETVFERFRQLDPSQPGTGLGLAICKNIVELHGGRISAQNEPNGGARFTVQLPSAPESNQPHFDRPLILD